MQLNSGGTNNTPQTQVWAIDNVHMYESDSFKFKIQDERNPSKIQKQKRGYAKQLDKYNNFI